MHVLSLLNCPKFLFRVMEEINEVLGDKSTLDADDVDKLIYLNQASIQYIVC